MCAQVAHDGQYAQPDTMSSSLFPQFEQGTPIFDIMQHPANNSHAFILTSQAHIAVSS
jgi:hypothetical protein